MNQNITKKQKKDSIHTDFEYTVLPYILSSLLTFLAYCGFVYVNSHIPMVSERSDVIWIIFLGCLFWAFTTTLIQSHITWILKWSFVPLDAFLLFLLKRKRKRVNKKRMKKNIQ